MCDNQSSIQMTKNPVFYKKTKHIDIQYHFVRDLVQHGVVEIEYYRTDKHVADIFTNALSRKSSANLEMILEYFQMIIIREEWWNNGSFVKYSIIKVVVFSERFMQKLVEW